MGSVLLRAVAVFICMVGDILERFDSSSPVLTSEGLLAFSVPAAAFAMSVFNVAKL